MKTTITILSALVILGCSNAFAQATSTDDQVASFGRAATRPVRINASSVLEPVAEEGTITTSQKGGAFTVAATKPAGICESSVLEPLEDSIQMQKGGTFSDAATKPAGIAKSSVLEPMDEVNINIASK